MQRVIAGFLLCAQAAVTPALGQFTVARARGQWVGSPSEEYARLRQLTGAVRLSSLMIRPTAADERSGAADTASWRDPWSARFAASRPATGGAALRVLNPVLRTTYNSGFPYGMNDGALWAGRGVSLSQTAGVQASVWRLAVDVIPTFTWSQNLSFVVGPQYGPPANSSPWADQYSGLGIDRPQRFGDSPLTTVDAGQSAATLLLGHARLGVASRNMWWGPGTQNSLLMSNNAAGLRHSFLGTDGPVATRLGNFEAMWVVGTMRQSKFWRIQPDTFATDRWLNALTLVYEPKGAPGMYFGATRAFYAYGRYNPITAREILTMVQTFVKSALADSANPFGADVRDQMLSLSFRWAFPQAGFEAYGEWGRNDHNWDRRDMVLQPDHGRGVLLGAAKVFRLRDGVLSVRFETANLANTLTYLSRATPVWYAHHQIQQGYTQQGQIIGAGIGPGSEQQTLAIDWFHPRGRWGFLLQRHRENIDGFYRVGLLDPYANDGSILLGPRVSATLGPLELDVLCQLQYEFNRYAIVHNDARNQRVELRAEYRLP